MGKYNFDFLTNLYPKSEWELKDSGLREFHLSTCTLGEKNNPDYNGPLEVGMTDNRGYFKIVSIGDKEEQLSERYYRKRR